ncbi:TlpA family protein disulfide reductase [Salibacterium salarium]|uniref:TlpA family protein disulfide reductase n=1 Tax=Salibacterium salarium TaxID=284579 RepID=A0A428MY43_9BACI|nr:TlpA disulfide reductase family protein [Salibacterium salarium]RSL31032.1 TlpA family protein disulfide reductase [Salibacterium salarium]
MRFIQKRLMFLSLCAVIFISGLFYQASHSPVKKAEQAVAGYPVAQNGETAPELELKGINQETYALQSFMDKPVLFTFFASWCGICQQELPKIASYYQENKDIFNFVAINATTEEYNKDDVYQFVKQGELSIPVLLDEEGKAMDAFQVTGVPISFLLNEQGSIVQSFYGPIQKTNLEEALKDTGQQPSSE